MENVPNEIVEKIIDKSRAEGMIILCGAGVSRNSGLPIVSEFLEYLLSSMGMNAQDIKLMLESKLPFEAFMGFINEHFSIERLLGAFSSGAPNLNHYVIAKLASIGLIREIYTTNFDSLLEQALNECEVQFKVVNYVKEEPFSKSECLVVHKLHGTHGGYMMADLKWIATKQWRNVMVSPVNRLFKTGEHSTVLVLGYSFSDRFDINPIIKETGCQSVKEIYLVNHNEDIKIETLDNHSVLSGFNGYQINCRTELIVNLIVNASNLEIDFKAHKSEGNSKWKNVIDEWICDIVSDNKNNRSNDLKNCIAQILIHIGRYLEAEIYLKDIVSNELNDHRKAKWAGNLAGLYLKLGRNHDAEALLLDNKHYFSKTTKDYSIYLNHMGSIKLIEYDNSKKERVLKASLDYFTESLKYIDVKISHRDYLGVRGNIILIKRRLGRYTEALKDINEVLEKSNELGELSVKATQLNNRGLILLQIGEKLEARKSFQEALMLSYEIEDAYMIDKSKQNLSLCN